MSKKAFSYFLWKSLDADVEFRNFRRTYTTLQKRGPNARENIIPFKRQYVEDIMEWTERANQEIMTYKDLIVNLRTPIYYICY